MRHRSDREEHEGEEKGIERRALLGILGMSGVLLAVSGVDAARDAAAPTAAPPPTPNCGPAVPCPSAAPPLPAKPDVAQLSALAKLIGVLVGEHTDARVNRRNFNNCPDKFIQWFGLSDEEVKTLLGFNPDDAFLYLAKGMPTQDDTAPNQAKWKAFLKLFAATDTFWTGWPNYSVKDCYDDPSWCTPEVSKQYAYPETRIKQVEGVTTLTVTCEGVVKPFTLQIFDLSNNEVTVTNAQRSLDSTFRCCRITADASLTAGTTYIARLTIAGDFVVEHKFQATS